MDNIFQNSNIVKIVPQSQNNNLVQQNNNNFISPLPERIPILYLWFGQDVPQDYLIFLSKIKYPIIFLKNPQDDRKWNRQILNIEMSDYYRLKYLYDNGGIYSDFDNLINYQCLMNLLKPYRNRNKLVFMTDKDTNKRKNNQIMNNLIFAPYPKMSILKKIIDGIDESKGKIWQFAGLKYLGQFDEPLQVQMYECARHTGDWSWFKDSNKVLNKNTEGRGEFIHKTLLKQDLINKNQKLEIQVLIYRAEVKKKQKDKQFVEVSDLGVKIKSTKLQFYQKN